MIRRQFLGPRWISLRLIVSESWNSCLHVLEGQSGLVSVIAFSPDWQLLPSASWYKTVRLWGTYTGALQSTLYSDIAEINTIAFSPNGQIVALASTETVQLSDTQTGTFKSTLKIQSRRLMLYPSHATANP
jgi:WD40 repeat protein